MYIYPWLIRRLWFTIPLGCLASQAPIPILSILIIPVKIVAIIVVIIIIIIRIILVIPVLLRRIVPALLLRRRRRIIGNRVIRISSLFPVNDIERSFCFSICSFFALVHVHNLIFITICFLKLVILSIFMVFFWRKLVRMLEFMWFSSWYLSFHAKDSSDFICLLVSFVWWIMWC